MDWIKEAEQYLLDRPYMFWKFAKDVWIYMHNNPSDFISLLGVLGSLFIGSVAIILSIQNISLKYKINHTLDYSPFENKENGILVSVIAFTNQSTFPIIINQMNISYYKKNKSKLTFRERVIDYINHYPLFKLSSKRFLGILNIFTHNNTFFSKSYSREKTTFHKSDNNLLEIQPYQTEFIQLFNSMEINTTILDILKQKYIRAKNETDKKNKYDNYNEKKDMYYQEAKFITSIKLKLSSGKNIKCSKRFCRKYTKHFNKEASIRRMRKSNVDWMKDIVSTKQENPKLPDTQAPEKE